MEKIIRIIELIVAILLVVSILMQNRGAGLSSTFGGDMGGYYNKRGFEKFLVYLTVILSSLFIILSIISLFLTRTGI